MDWSYLKLSPQMDPHLVSQDDGTFELVLAVSPPPCIA